MRSHMKKKLNNLLYCCKKRWANVESGKFTSFENFLAAFARDAEMLNLSKKELFMKSKVCLQLCVFCKLNRTSQPQKICYLSKKARRLVWSCQAMKEKLFSLTISVSRIFILALPGRSVLKAFWTISFRPWRGEQSITLPWQITCFFPFVKESAGKKWRTCCRINHFPVRMKREQKEKGIRRRINKNIMHGIKKLVK